MIAALIALKRKCPGLWNRVEDVNGLLFRIRYRRLPEKATEILKRREVAGYRYSLLEEMDLPELNAFLNAQPAENLIWFHPHLFDAKTLRRLWRNPAFLMMQVTAPDGRMAGYFFLRGFFIGRAFAGLIVDRAYQNQGIGTAIWASCAEICHAAGLKMQATIAPENQPSIKSCHRATEVRQIADLDDGYMAVQCYPKK
ncbi:MAG: GNAT family N-acetyltransferase [Bacteroidales bacterium]|nr:GNAT family N-acetyltransferase [Bacteroidales bacterium]